MKNQIVNAQEYGLEEKSAKEIESAFLAKVEEKKFLIEQYNEVVKLELNEETCKTARALRLKSVSVRGDIAKIHKTQKAYFLSAGRFVDAWKNKEIEPLSQMEEKLMAIEKHQELEEAKKLEALQLKREKELAPYIQDDDKRQLSGMDQDVWEAFLSTKKKHHEERIEAEKLAEKTRIEEAEKEAERLRLQELENKKLKEEAEQKAKEDAEKAKILEVRTKELQPYIVFIRDYNALINKNESDYQKEFKDTVKGAQDHWEFERKEQIKKQQAEEKEAKEKKALERKLEAEKLKHQKEKEAQKN